MAQAKKPQDHKPAVKKTDTAFEVTVRGISVSIEKEALNDFELFDDMSEVLNGNSTRLAPLLKRMFGPEQYKKVLDGLRGENGRVKVTDVGPFLMDVFKAVDPNA